MASCRICYAPDTPRARLLQPCACTGTHAYICKTCLCTWVNVRTQTYNYTSVTAPYTCELCLQPFVIRRTATRMQWQWELWEWELWEWELWEWELWEWESWKWESWGGMAVHDVLLLCGACGASSVLALVVDVSKYYGVVCIVVSLALLLLCSISAQVLWRRYCEAVTTTTLL